ncbi:MAG: Snf7 family [Lentinula lateritia]|uniref:Snf7 family n=1 Tax=Lentinula lateritia TaxID=40482 RepID=A0ABQ8VVI4_9AGAR|nr:MAG: Snf7 family [Lentinula lateritia]KAJ4499515.1 Snf7 family [Lentinula lateritia]
MGGNQSAPKITAQDRAILDLKLQRDKVKQYQKNLQAILDREEAIAKQHLEAGHKDRALVALRRRKYQQGLLLKTDGQLENLQQLVSSIEFSLVEVSVLHGLKQGNEVLKEIHKEMNLESVEKLLEETAEAREYQREIDEMLANNLSLDEEDAVQAELRELQAAVRAETEPSNDVQLPSVPTSAPLVAEPVAPEERVERDSARIAIPA